MEQPVALLLLTRDPTGPLTGRKTVLATVAASLEALGWRVEVAAPARASGRSPRLAGQWLGRRVHPLPAPALPLLPVRGAAALAAGRHALNEVLFSDARVRRAAASLAADVGARVVVADSIRLAEAALATGLPVIAHLDDLLSDRYAAQRAAGASAESMLGFYGEQLPGRLRPVAERAARAVLGREAAVLRRREVVVSRAVAAVAVTSPAEATVLARRSGRPVLAAPMAVDIDPDPSQVAAATATSAVFLGWLGYAPNSSALRWWRDAVRPELDRLGGADVTVTVVGGTDGLDPRQVAELADDRLRFVGYVEDLRAELRRHRLMVAPVTAGTGLKTKVLDGLAVALPVVGTPLALAGLDVSDGDQAWLGADATSFAERVLLARDDAARAAAVGERGRELLAKTWSGPALVARWAELLELAGVH